MGTTNQVVIIGAGPAGLTAAYLLSKEGVPVTVLEADPQYAGGIARTVQLCDMFPRLRAIGVADPRRTEPGFLKAVEAQIDNNRNKIVAFKAYLGYLLGDGQKLLDQLGYAPLPASLDQQAVAQLDKITS